MSEFKLLNRWCLTICKNITHQHQFVFGGKLNNIQTSAVTLKQIKSSSSVAVAATLLNQQSMDLKTLVKHLNDYADLRLAADWDNVGLLVEPTSTLNSPFLINRLLITNDLTEPVLEEALAKRVQLILAYHPPIFAPFKRLTQSDWKQRVIIKLLENKIALYSPHTSWDSVHGGVNDWILSVFDLAKVEPIETQHELTTPSGGDFNKSLRVNVLYGPTKDKLISKVAGLSDDVIRFVGEQSVTASDAIKLVELEFLSTQFGCSKLIELLKAANYDENILKTLRIYDLTKANRSDVGHGRLGYLTEPLTIRQVSDKLKAHFKMNTLRIALANGKTLDDKVKTIGVCAGSGSKLLNNKQADLLVTGEFSHHEILHENHRGVSLILTDHSNCERGHHAYFAKRFEDHLKKKFTDKNVEILISEVDRDPLQYI